MLVNLEIENFRSIRNLRLPINDLNILIGPNNSGKSSIFHVLAFLKQSVHGLSLDGSLVRLGAFDEVVFKHSPDTRIYISFSMCPAYREEESDPYAIARRRKLTCSICIAGSDGNLILRHARLFDDRRNEMIAAYEPYEKVSPQDLPKDILEARTRTQVQGFVPFLEIEARPLARRVQTEPDSVKLSKAARGLITEELSDYLHYISSSRGTLQRRGSVDSTFSQRPSDVGINGEKTMQILTYIRDDDKYVEALDKFSYWSSEFGLENIISRIASGPTYELRGRNQKIDVQSNIVDVGFGLNQLIPVILQCFYAQKGSLLLIEQPEAHLHPRAQAQIADFLIDVVNYGNRVMVETHSEHLLLRLQRRVAEKKIDSKRIGIHYFEQTPSGTAVNTIAIDASGNFSGKIPEGFFEEGFQEALAHLKAIKSPSDKA